MPPTIEIQEKIAETPDFILADPSEIHQVLMNLCTNSIHAMKKDGGTLKIILGEKDLGPKEASVWTGLAPGQYLMLTVSDTGHGMESPVMEHIFDPYFTTKPAGEGTGLGLAVVHGIIKSCGGMIKVESKPGNGSSFNILLPRVESKTILETESYETIPRGREKILFLDDEDSIVNMAKQMLEGLDYTVDTETSGTEALTLFREHPEAYDLVITGMTLPKMTEDAFSKELIRIRPDIPIILCTGHRELITDEQAKEAGIKAFVFKPVTMRGLANTIRQVLDSP